MTDRLKISWTGGPSASPGRRLFGSPVGLALVGVILVVVLFNLIDWAAELLWFRALGYGLVFWRLRLAEVAMFAIGFIPVFAYVLVNLLVLAKLADLHTLLPRQHPAAGMPQGWPRTGVTPRNVRQLTPLLIVASAAAAAVFGFAFAGEWDRLLRLVWAQTFGSIRSHLRARYWLLPVRVAVPQSGSG